MEMEGESRLVRLCIEEACRSRESVEKWRRQRRSLERMPSHLADALLRCLLHRRLLFPSLLEVFKNSVEEINLRGENSVDAEWMAYLGAFHHLRTLNVANCHRITSSALWAITGLTGLKEIDLSRCLKVTDAGIRHLLSIPTLEKLWISETGLTVDGVVLLSSLKNLSVLDLGGLPVTDVALNSLQVLTKLQYLDLWGSKITDKGAEVLHKFPQLSFLNLAWTKVTKLPNISSLGCLNLSNCIINSVLEGDGDKAPLARLIFSGVTFMNETEAFLYIETSFLSFLDVSNSSLQNFCFLAHMKMLEHLDISSSMIGDDSVELVACIGANLRNLNLSRTRVSSVGVGILVGHVPNLEVLSLSHTSIDDVAISYISMMPSLKVIDLSNTNIKGFVYQVDTKPDSVPSLSAMQNLNYLERLNLDQTQVRDAAVYPLLNFKQLSHLSLRNASLTDASLYHLSSLPKLVNLGIRDAVLTDHGLDSFRPQAALEMLDLRGCWLLTEDGILSLCKRYPQIEIRHELSNRSAQTVPSPSRMSFKMKQVNKKQERVPMSQCLVETDQRLKYTKVELLALQYSDLSLASPCDRGTVIPNSLLD